MTLSFLIKKSTLRAIEIEPTFFHSLGNPKGNMLNYFYDSHIRHNFSYKLIPIYIDELGERFPKLSMKDSKIAYTYWDEFRYHNKCIKMSMDACLCLVVTMNG